MNHPAVNELHVPGLDPENQRALNELGQTYSKAFAAQFAAEPLALRFHFGASRFLRRALADIFWPGPSFRSPLHNLARPLALAAPELLSDPALAALFDSVEHDRARGVFKFSSGFEPLGFIAGLLVGLQSHPPPRAAQVPPQSLEIPSRLAELQPQWARDRRTRPLLDLAAMLRHEPPPPGVTPLLFGSLAGPPPWPAYADVDLAIYLDTRVRADILGLLNFIKRFRRLARRVLAVDPVQHHGPYILLESDLPVYPPSQLPPEALRLATTLSDAPLTLALAPLAEDRIFSLEAFAAAWRGLRHLAGSPRSFEDRYTAKTFSSLVLLLPALCCGCLGRPVEKSASFATIKTIMDEKNILTIEAFEALRREWHWSLGVPAPLLALAGSRAAWLARTVNRWPAPELAARLSALAPRVEPLCAAMLDRLAREAGL